MLQLVKDWNDRLMLQLLGGAEQDTDQGEKRQLQKSPWLNTTQFWDDLYNTMSKYKEDKNYVVIAIVAIVGM